MLHMGVIARAYDERPIDGDVARGPGAVTAQMCSCPLRNLKQRWTYVCFLDFRGIDCLTLSKRAWRIVIRLLGAGALRMPEAAWCGTCVVRWVLH